MVFALRKGWGGEIIESFRFREDAGVYDFPNVPEMFLYTVKTERKAVAVDG